MVAWYPARRRRPEVFGKATTVLRPRRWGWIALACMVPLAILDQLFRSSNGVIGPDLMQELEMGPDSLGALSASLFIVSAAVQIPIGLLLDRHRACRLVCAMLVFAACGSLLFALSDTVIALTAARSMIGIGFAGMMVGSLVILSRWFTSAQFTKSMGILFAFSNAGTLIATWPLAAATELWGWRTVFVALAFGTAALTLVFFAFVHEAPRGHACPRQSPESLDMAIARLWDCWKITGVASILPMIGIGYASVIAVLGLWGGPFLHDVHGLDPTARGRLLSVMAIAMISGTLAYGHVEGWIRNRRKLVTYGAVAAIVPLCALAVWPDAPLWQVAILLLLFCFFGAYSVVVMAHGIDLFPDSLKGRGTTTLNMALLAGTALTQIASGRLVGSLAGREETGAAAVYGSLFLCLAAATAAALIVYWRVPNGSPRETRREDRPPPAIAA